MKKIYRILLVFGIFSTLAVHYNNCSEASFSDDPGAITALVSAITITKYPGDHSVDEDTVFGYEVDNDRNIIKEVKCFLNGVEFECSDTGETITWEAGELPEGDYTVVVNGYDHAGKVIATAETGWIIFDGFTKKELQHVVTNSNVDNSSVDVLIIVDNSGSMAEEQANMADRIQNFLDEIDSLNWRVAVTSTDYRDFGMLYAFPNGAPFIKKGDYSLAQARDVLAARVQLGDNGDGTEMPIRALKKSIENRSQYNFFRQNVGLSVVIITDEDEFGNNFGKDGVFHEKVTPDQMVSFVQTTWPQKPFFVNALIWDPTVPGVTCPNQSSERRGDIVDDLRMKTGGILGSVCSQDYGAELKDIGQQTAKVETSVALDCQPQDINNDGTPDVDVTGTNVPNYTVNGVNITFDSPLAPGSYTFSYWCPPGN